MTQSRLIARNIDTGLVVADRVAVAATKAERAVGLLNRSSLDPGEALWIVPSRGVHTCWMRFPIDLIALDERNVVIDRVSCLRPWRVRLPRRGTAGVLEMPAGVIDSTGTAIGHRIAFEPALRENPCLREPGERENGSTTDKGVSPSLLLLSMSLTLVTVGAVL